MTICRKSIKNSVSQNLKICKIRTLECSAVLILIRQLGKKFTRLCKCLEIRSQIGFRELIILNIQNNSPTQSFSTLLLDNIEN